MKKICTILFTAFALTSAAQSPDIEWAKCFGSNREDAGVNFLRTNDRGYLIAGYGDTVYGDYSNGVNYQAQLIKLDSNFNQEWKKNYGNGVNEKANEYLRQVIKVDDGYVFVGYTYYFDFQYPSTLADVWIVKINMEGVVQWQKTFIGNQGDEAYSVQQTTEGDLVVLVLSYSSDGDFTSPGTWLLKLTGAGEVIWKKKVDGIEGITLKQTYDSGFIITGRGDYLANRLYDCYLLKTDRDGNVEWLKNYGGSDQDFGFDAVQTSDSGYIIAAETKSLDGDVTFSYEWFDCWVIKTDKTGNIQWQKSLGGNDRIEYAKTIAEVADGYVVLCNSSSTDGDVKCKHADRDIWVAKLTFNGEFAGGQTYGGNKVEIPSTMEIEEDGSILLAGSTNSSDGDITGFTPGIYGTENDSWMVKLKPLIILPLTLVSFTATEQNKTVLLSWTTANEINNSFFTVEKSKDGVYFTTAGTVAANTQSQTQNNYFFTDKFPLTGTSYYRLKQTDKDGKFTYSKIIPINIAAIYKMLIKPNPSANGIFNIDLGTIRNNIVVTITDNNGKQVHKQQILSAQAININLANKPKGIYYLQATYDGGGGKEKLVVE